MVTQSKHDLQSKLDLSLKCVCSGDSSGIRIYGSTLAEGCGRRRAKVWMIENIKELCAKLRIESLVDLRVLEYSEVHIKQSGADQAVPSNIAGRSHDRHSEARWIEPLIGFPDNGALIGAARENVWPFRVLRCLSLQTLVVKPDHRVERNSANRRRESVNLPTFDELVAAQWNHVHGIRREVVRPVEGRAAVIVGATVRIRRPSPALPLAGLEPDAVGYLIQGFRPRIGYLCLEIVAETMIETGLQRVVVGSAHGLEVHKEADSLKIGPGVRNNPSAG